MTAINYGPGAAATPLKAAASRAPRTRAGTTWLMAGIAALVFAAPIIFVVQNSGSSRVSFLFLHERRSVTLALLAVAAAGWVSILLLGAARI